MNHHYVLAYDVGQQHDYTAGTVIHATGEGRQRRYAVKHIERYRGVSYPDVAQRITNRYEAVKRLAASTHAEPCRVDVVIDATGVGRAVVEFVRRDFDLRARGITITGGVRSSVDKNGFDNVAKVELVTTAQAALQSRRLQVSGQLPLARLLTDELRGFRVSISDTGHARFGNDAGSVRTAEHDDLVLSVALGVWYLERRRGLSPEVRRRLLAAHGW